MLRHPLRSLLNLLRMISTTSLSFSVMSLRNLQGTTPKVFFSFLSLPHLWIFNFPPLRASFICPTVSSISFKTTVWFWLISLPLASKEFSIITVQRTEEFHQICSIKNDNQTKSHKKLVKIISEWLGTVDSKEVAELNYSGCIALEAKNRLRMIKFQYAFTFYSNLWIQRIFQGTLIKYLIFYPVLGNSLHSQERDSLHNFQFRTLKYPHIHHHYHSLLHEDHIYFGLYSNSKSYHCFCRFHGHCNWLHLHMQLPRTKKCIQQIQIGRVV